MNYSINWTVGSDPKIIEGTGPITGNRYKITWNSGNQFFDEHTFIEKPYFEIRVNDKAYGYNHDIHSAKVECDIIESNKMRDNRLDSPHTYMINVPIQIKCKVTYNSASEFENMMIKGEYLPERVIKVLEELPEGDEWNYNVDSQYLIISNNEIDYKIDVDDYDMDSTKCNLFCEQPSDKEISHDGDK